MSRDAVPDPATSPVQTGVAVRGRTAVWAVATLAIGAVAACNGHLDFGAGGAAGTGAAAGSSGTGGRAGAGGRGGGTGGTSCPTGQGGTGQPSCTNDADCGPSTLHCDVNGSNACVQCVSDTHCIGTTLPHCNTALHRCVVCIAKTDCATTETCASGRCVQTCETPTSVPCPTGTACEDGICHACGHDNLTCGSATPVCLGPAWICVGCATDCDCSGSSPKCDPVRHTCGQCASSADCPASARFCEPTSGTCVSG